MILAENKRAYFDYEVLEKFTAGLVLTGSEVKSIKIQGMDLRGSYVIIDNKKEAYLINSSIAPYPYSSEKFDPKRNRKILLKKKEISYLIGKTKQKGLTSLPLKVYTKNGLIKIEIALCRGRKKYEKKELIKKREEERKIREFLRFKN